MKVLSGKNSSHVWRSNISNVVSQHTQKSTFCQIVAVLQTAAMAIIDLKKKLKNEVCHIHQLPHQVEICDCQPPFRYAL